MGRGGGRRREGDVNHGFLALSGRTDTAVLDFPNPSRGADDD
jgi:hypothetical protein